MDKTKKSNINDKVKEVINNIPALEIQSAVFKSKGIKPTLKQVEFAKQDLLLDNHKQAFKIAYNPCGWKENSIEAKACEINKNVKVELSKGEILQKIADIVPDAVDTLHELVSQRKNLLVARQASDSILDRAGYQPIQKVEQATISISKEQFERLLRHMEDE